ncbi:MAG TPA: hypothetical protein VLW85_12365 [Myxococcales bacterium]|nr:hypothetical protein [Myxococcales bacterium]
MATVASLAAAGLVAIFGFHRQKPVEKELAGVEVGGPTVSIERAHRGLLKHHLEGATLWEACNQKTLEMFTFAEEPIACGYVASVEFSRAASAGDCRDPTGALPDLHLEAVTPRGIGLDATEADIRKAYGKPWKTEQGRGETYLHYRSKLKKHPSGATALRLVFTLRNGKTTSVSLDLDGPMFEKSPKSMAPCRN